MTPAEIFLSDRLQELPLRRVRAHGLPRQRHRFIDRGLGLGRIAERDAPPLLLFRLGPLLFLDARLQLAHRDAWRPRPRHPDVLDIPDRHAHHRFRLARAHLTCPNRLVQTRPIPQRLREASHLDRRARRQPEPFAGVVADVRVPELEHPIPHRQRIERFSDGHFQSAATARHANEERIDQPSELVARRLVALARQRPFQEESRRAKRFKQLVKWRRGGRISKEVSFTHPSLIAAPSDIRGCRNLHPRRTRPPPTESSRPAATRHHKSRAPLRPPHYPAQDMPRTIRTMCPMNCHPTLCGMLVDLDDSSRLLRVRGDPENPDSRGFLCIRGHAAREIIGNPQRVLSPLHRAEKSGTWRPIAWTDALDLISEEARAAGPAAVGTWSGHGFFANNYGTRLSSELLRRFANLYGCQWWTPTMICWGLGAFGLGLTGILEVNTKEDMGESSALILLWGANLASQPNTGRHLAAAKRRGAHVVTIDVRRTEASAQSDETLLVRPGTDAALALGLMHVVLEEGLHDAAFVARHTVGFDALRAHLTKHDAAWASGITGVAQDRIVALARRYATTRPAMILLGGSSMYKGRAGWQGSRAVSCLPALTGNLGIPGGGMGPRHAGLTHGQALASIAANDRRPPGDDVPQQMSRITDALETSRLRVLLLFGTDMVSSFADAGRLERALGKLDLLATYDLFMHDTARRHADLFLPATTWLEDTGCKSTNTHLYLMPKVLEPAGEARSPGWVLRELARRLDVH